MAALVFAALHGIDLGSPRTLYVSAGAAPPASSIQVAESQPWSILGCRHRGEAVWQAPNTINSVAMAREDRHVLAFAQQRLCTTMQVTTGDWYGCRSSALGKRTRPLPLLKSSLVQRRLTILGYCFGYASASEQIVRAALAAESSASARLARTGAPATTTSAGTSSETDGQHGVFTRIPMQIWRRLQKMEGNGDTNNIAGPGSAASAATARVSGGPPITKAAKATSEAPAPWALSAETPWVPRPLVTEDDARIAVGGPEGWQRGWALMEKLSDLRITASPTSRDAAVISAVCSGSGGEAYDVSCEVGPDGIDEPHCTCAAHSKSGRNAYCKHVAALLVTYVQRRYRFAAAGGAIEASRMKTLEPGPRSPSHDRAPVASQRTGSRAIDSGEDRLTVGTAAAHERPAAGTTAPRRPQRPALDLVPLDDGDDIHPSRERDSARGRPSGTASAAPPSSGPPALSSVLPAKARARLVIQRGDSLHQTERQQDAGAGHGGGSATEAATSSRRLPSTLLRGPAVAPAAAGRRGPKGDKTAGSTALPPFRLQGARVLELSRRIAAGEELLSSQNLEMPNDANGTSVTDGNKVSGDESAAAEPSATSVGSAVAELREALRQTLRRRSSDASGQEVRAAAGQGEELVAVVTKSADSGTPKPSFDKRPSAAATANVVLVNAGHDAGEAAPPAAPKLNDSSDLDLSGIELPPPRFQRLKADTSRASSGASLRAATAGAAGPAHHTTDQKMAEPPPKRTKAAASSPAKAAAPGAIQSQVHKKQQKAIVIEDEDEELDALW